MAIRLESIDVLVPFGVKGLVTNLSRNKCRRIRRTSSISSLIEKLLGFLCSAEGHENPQSLSASRKFSKPNLRRNLWLTYRHDWRCYPSWREINP